MFDYEKLGAFYLGRTWDPDARALGDEVLLYPSKQLTTHAVVLGMTGSGKTGLSIGLLEEAAIDGIPAICIDPKGDLGNLLLTFPKLAAEDFRPWIDEEEARRKGVDADTFAANTAATWKKGLAEWGQEPDRIRRLKDAAEVVVYTPGSNAGVPLALLRSFDAPRAELDDESLRERISAAVSGLLGLIGVDADPMQSREHILLSRLIGDAWAKGEDLDLAALIQGIQKPGFDRIGVLDLESFYPQKDRFGLAMSLNNLLASPGAQAWMEGEPLDIQKMLTGAGGKPKISIVSIAHLSDAQRMFFVATLLSEMVAWVRTQTGTSSLRAILFMDEIYGYFPPTANPPTKTPMLTLLKQARAFGLGVVLATQNPVDLDYKGLANCGTWFIGRLQTERDKMRVLEGLEGAAASSGKALDRAKMDTILSGLGNRVFLLNSVHADGPVLFQTRWTLSYLRGPITREEIKRLTGTKPAPKRVAQATAAATTSARPVLPNGVEERFLGEGSTYVPFLLGVAKVHYVDAKNDVDAWEDLSLLAPMVDDERIADWAGGEALDARLLRKTPNADASFEDAPAQVGKKGADAAWKKAFASWIYQDHPAVILRCAPLGVAGAPGEDAAVLRSKMAFAAREHRDEQIEALKKKLQPKIDAFEEKIRKAEAKVAKEQADAKAATVSTVASWGNAIFGALFGSGSAVTKVASAAKTTSRGMAARTDVQQAEADVAELKEAEYELVQTLEAETKRITEETEIDTLPITEVRVPARKSDTQVLAVYVVWKSIDG